MFKCEYCGKEYNSPAERANCEIKCYEKAQAEAEKVKKEKLRTEQTERLKVIQDKTNELNKLRSDYRKDYNREPVLNIINGHLITNDDSDKFFEVLRWL